MTLTTRLPEQTRPAIDALIFDLDGTLLDSEILWVEATEEFLRAHDPGITRDVATALVYGRSWHDVYRDIRRRLTHLHMGLEEMQRALAPHFQRLKRTRDIRIVSSIELLKRLAATRPCCIVSGSPREDIRDGIELMGIGSHLRFYLGAEDYAPGKPDPACFLMAAERLGVPPARCLVFEDSAAGVTAAKRAGMSCIGLARPGRPPQNLAGADLVVGDLADAEVAALLGN